MAHPDRRSFLAVLAGLPVVASWREALFPQQAPPPRDPEWKSKYLAVQFLRIINTAQLWNRHSQGYYVPKSEFLKCSGFEALKNQIRPNGVPFPDAWPHVRDLSVNDDLTVPGWDFALEASSDRLKYVAVITQKSDEKRFAFANDDGGIIYQGERLEASSSEELSAESAVRDPRPLGESSKSVGEAGFGLFASISALGLLNWLLPPCPSAWCKCCGDFPCICSCPCLSQCPAGCSGPGCYHCGCQSCLWCVCTYCGNPLCDVACHKCSECTPGPPCNCVT